MRWSQALSRSPVARTIWIQALKDARKARGMSQAELGARVGLPQSHISRIERGEVDVGLSALLEISRSLGLEPIPIPRSLVPAVRSLIRTGAGGDAAEPRPTYALDEDDD